MVQLSSTSTILSQMSGPFWRHEHLQLCESTHSHDGRGAYEANLLEKKDSHFSTVFMLAPPEVSNRSAELILYIASCGPKTTQRYNSHGN